MSLARSEIRSENNEALLEAMRMVEMSNVPVRSFTEVLELLSSDVAQQSRKNVTVYTVF